MPMITLNGSETFQSVTLTADEIWQCRKGKVLVSNEAIVDQDQGIELIHGSARQLREGDVVRFKSADGAPASICREAS